MSLEEETLASVHGSSSTRSMTAPLSDEAVSCRYVAKALDADRFAKDKDPLTFWGDVKSSVKLPILRRVALQALPRQPTSGDVERAASKGSLIVTKRRSRLKGKAASDLVAAASMCATNLHATRKKKAEKVN